MKTSPTETRGGGTTLIVSFDQAGRPRRHWLLDGGEVECGDADDPLPADPRSARVVLGVPGDQVTVRWLELAGDLAPAQAAAAARLMLADASAEPLSRMHVAVGRPERGLTPAALVPADLMSSWLDRAAQAGLDPEAIVPEPMLLAPPAEGYRRRDLGDVADYRGPAAAFTLEPGLAEVVIANAPVEPVDEARFEAELAAMAAAPALNLRQGPFARRRQWRFERGRLRRLSMLALALLVLTLLVQVATILVYTFAADRLETEAEALAAGTTARTADAGPGFGPLAAALFEAVRATPNVEMTRLEYRPEGSLAASLMFDSPTTLAALRARLETSGLRVEADEMRSAGGRPTADVTLGPA